MKKICASILSILVLSACAPSNFEGLQQIASTTAGSVGCRNFESKTWDAINNYLIETKGIPLASEVKQNLKSALKDVKSAQGPLSDAQLELLSQDIGELYDLLLVEAANKEKVQTSVDLLTVLSALELGDHTTATKVELQSKVGAQFAKIKAHVQSLQVSCSNPGQDETDSASEDLGSNPIDANGSSLPPALFGANWTMATAYQTCQALTEPAMTLSTPDAQGIEIVGTHSDGIGSKRMISSVSALLKTHPYYKNVNNYGASCVNMRSSPLIYDYGGRPYVSLKAGAPLNLFKDSGDGTKVLGIDCSGYVYTSLATAGLRLSPFRNIKATGVYGISSSMFVEPQSNQMSCLQKISVKPKDTLRPGDIVAVQGHVLMIDHVGADPFGLNSVKSVADCSKITHRGFDFVVIQSSNSKEGVGINRFEAKDYLEDSPKMKASLERYAYYSCLARFNHKTYTPNLGTSSVVRHTGAAACKGTRIALTQESCIRSCPQLVQ